MTGCNAGIVLSTGSNIAGSGVGIDAEIGVRAGGIGTGGTVTPLRDTTGKVDRFTVPYWLVKVIDWPPPCC